MIRYSVQLEDRIFVKCYRISSFSKNVGKNNGKIRSKNLSLKYRQKHFHHAKKSDTDAKE